MYLYSVFDRKAQTYDTPFVAVNDSVASRMFSDLVNRKDNLVGLHPEDFELTRIGFFDHNRGRLFLDETMCEGDIFPNPVCSAVALVKESESA